MPDLVSPLITIVTIILLGLLLLRSLLFLVIAFRTRNRNISISGDHFEAIDIIIAAYNEEKVIVKTMDSLLKIDYPNFTIHAVNDGSTDSTLALLKSHYQGNPKVKILSIENSGKVNALNHGIANSSAPILTFIDADTQVNPTILKVIAQGFRDEKLVAIAGALIPSNPDRMITFCQYIEYTTQFNLERDMFGKINATSVIPGANGSYRREALLNVDGFASDTLTEDFDTTFKLLKNNLKIGFSKDAVAFTEVPDTWRMFFRQRVRWYYGSLQNFAKHRKLYKDNSGLIYLFSYSWLYHIVYSLLIVLADYLFVASLLRADTSVYVYLNFVALESFVFLVVVARELRSRSLQLKTLTVLLYRIVYRHLKFHAFVLSIYHFVFRTNLKWKTIKRSSQSAINVEPTNVEPTA